MARALVKTVDGAVVGEIKTYTGNTVPVNFLFCDAKTIGNASSGATSRANADTQNLFVHLWTNFSNTEAPVSGGRGGSALADFNANKTIQLPDLRGRTTAGKDDMGGSAANRLTNAGSGITGTTLGTAGGAETHTLSMAQMPSHDHGGGNHMHNMTSNATNGNAGTAAPYSSLAAPSYTNTDDIQLSGTIISTQGSGNAHNNTQPTFIVTKIIRY